MLFINTLFDKLKDGRPLISGIYDDNSRKLELCPLYINKSGKSIYQIEQDCARIRDAIRAHKSVVVNDNKQHLVAFGDYDNHVFDLDVQQHSVSSRISVTDAKKIIAKNIKYMTTVDRKYWQVVRGDAARVYYFLQNKGLMLGYNRVDPIWSMHTFSGRSKAEGFSVQNQDGPIYNINGDKIFLHFDWISADMRAVAIMSGDQELNNSFYESDPYSYMADKIKGVERSECKKAILSSIYSLNYDNPAFHFYSGVRDWIMKCQNRLAKQGYLQSILKRKFYVDDNRSDKSVFNAMVQGSVAHAMQLCIRRSWDIYPDNILTDNHDSLVLTCRDSSLAKEIISEVSRIMVHPFEGILNSNPRFPLVVSIGKNYKRWQKYKRYQ